MEVKVKFNDINVKEEKEKTLVKILMLKGEKGDTASAEWGTITGNLESQTDLENALNSKANKSEMEQALNQKANSSDLNNYYNKNQMDTALGAKIGTEDIVDTLDSTSVDKVLSADKGRVLNEKIEKNEKNEKYPSVNIHRLGRWLYDTGYNNVNSDTTIDYYSQSQGACLIDSNTIAIAYTRTKNNISEATTKIRIYSLITGQLLREQALNIGHANGMIYRSSNNSLYATECFVTSGNYTNKVYVINATTLEITDTLEINGLDLNNNIFLNLDYDEENDKFYAMQRFIVHELDDNFNIINTINLETQDIVQPGTYQVIHAHNGNFYMCNSYPNYIHVFNNEGKTVQHYQLNYWSDDCFFIGELEDISFNGDDIYLVSCKYLCELSDTKMTQVFKLNLLKDTSVLDLNRLIPNYRKILIVSTTNVFNPQGISTLPFNELAEAIEFCMSPMGQNINSIKLNAGTYKWCSILNIPQKLLIYSDNNSTTIVNGLTIENSNIMISKIKLTTTQTDSYGENPLNLIRSGVTLDNVAFIIDNSLYTTLIKNTQTKLDLYNSTPSLGDNTTFISTTFASQLNYRGEIKNIKTSGNHTDFGNYPLTDDIQLQTGSIPKNSFLTQQNLGINTYIYPNKYIYFAYKDSSSREYIAKFETKSATTRTFKINNMEINNNNFYINEMIIQLQSNALSITSNTSVDKDGIQQATPHLTLTKVYVSQY